MKLIRDRHGRIDVLGNQCAEPEDWWKKLQTIPCTKNKTWHTAYPLTGGAVNVQKGTYKVIGDVTEEQIDRHFRQCMRGGKGMFNPASETVMRLWEQEQKNVER